MRPVRIIAAVAAAGSYIARSTAHPSAAPAPPATAAPPSSVASRQPVADPGTPSPGDRGSDADAPRPVLADGRYDAYIRRVEVPDGGGTGRLVVDVVQVFHDRAAVSAAIADGTPRDRAQYLSVWVRNQNPRLRTLPLAGDVRLDLHGGDCEGSRSQQLTTLAADARLMSGPVHTYYYTLTVAGGSVHRVKEILAINAC